MGAGADESAVRQDEDAVRVHRGYDALSDNDPGPARKLFVQRLADLGLGEKVQRGKGIVENIDWCVL